MKKIFTPNPAYFWKKLAVFFLTHLATLIVHVDSVRLVKQILFQFSLNFA